MGGPRPGHRSSRHRPARSIGALVPAVAAAVGLVGGCGGPATPAALPAATQTGIAGQVADTAGTGPHGTTTAATPRLTATATATAPVRAATPETTAAAHPSSPPAPSPLPSDAYDAVPGLTGTTATGYLTAVSPGHPATLTYDKVTFHWCTPAERDTGPGCPDDYRITDDNPRLRKLPVAPDAVLLVLEPGHDTATRLTLTQLAAHARAHDLVDLRVDASGTVTGAAVPYTP